MSYRRAVPQLALLGILSVLASTLFSIVVHGAISSGVAVSKGNVYVVLEPPPAVWVSKGNAYAVLEPPPAVWVSKANAYAVIEPPQSVWVSKAVAYAVIGPPPQTSLFIMTQNKNACTLNKESMCRREAGFLLSADGLVN